jgi:hypothetical protein
MPERCAVCDVLLRPSKRPRKATCERGACAREYRQRVEAAGGRPCPVCGRPADGETCGDDYCRGEAESRRARKDLEAERLAAKEAAARRVEEGLRAAGALPSEARAVVLPATDRPLISRDPSRGTLFAERLAELLEDAAADPDGPTGDPPSPEGPVSPSDALARSACASCRGLCCRHGEPHAFLRPATLRRYLKLHPGETPARALEEYLSRIPTESVAGSCIYHGRQGCALPRSMRSDVCNRYLCDDLERLLAASRDNPASQNRHAPPVVAVGFEEDRLVRVSLLAADGVRTLSEPPSGPGPAAAPPAR